MGGTSTLKNSTVARKGHIMRLQHKLFWGGGALFWGGGYPASLPCELTQVCARRFSRRGRG